MAYAVDILEPAFHRTKELFFPVRPGYWLRMGFISLLGTSGTGYNLGNISDSASRPLSDVDAQAFIAQYGVLIGAIVMFFSVLGLAFTYINSVFMFMFVDGIEQKKVSVRKSFSDQHRLGFSLFLTRLVVGFIVLLAIVVILGAVVLGFMQDTIFGLAALVPVLIIGLPLLIAIGLFWFLVYDLVVPIMYKRNLGFRQAWKLFITHAKSKKLEIVLYWLFRLILGVASSVVLLVLLLPALLVILLLGGMGVLLYFAGEALGGMGILIAVVYAVVVVPLLIYAFAVVTVPISAFFRVYSLEMVEKLIPEHK